MLPLPEDIAACLAQKQINGLYWMAAIDFPAPTGTLYLSETKEITWDGHTWLPLLDPEEPVGDVEQALKLDEKNDTSINVINTNGAISALIRSNDVENRECRIYLYFDEKSNAYPVYRGICSKPDALVEGVVEIPVVPHLHGPRVKLPGEKATVGCRFAPHNFGDGKNCLYDPANGYGSYQTGTTPFASCPGTRAECALRGMTAVNKKSPWDASSDPLPWCNFAGFQKFKCKIHGSYKSGFLGLGRTHYTSNSRWSDNFLGAAIPLVYGLIRTSGLPFYSLDESDFFLGGAILSDGRCDGITGSTDVYLNGDNSHQYPWFAQGWIGQRRPNYLPMSDSHGAIPDAYAGTCYAVVRVPDERGISSDRDAEIECVMKGRQVADFQKVDGQWVKGDTLYWSDDPINILADLICSDRGGLRFGYDAIDATLFEHRAYSWETITDVDGVSRRRYKANGTIMDATTAGEVLERFRDEFSLWFRLYGDKIKWGFIRPDETSVYTFDHAVHNIMVNEDGSSSVEVSEDPCDDIPNRLYVSFLDEDNYWEKTTFHLDSLEQQAKTNKIIDESVFLGWTTNVGQALRIASNRFERLVSGNYKASWRSPIACLAVEVGDVVTLVSDHLPSGSQTMLVTKKRITAEFDVEFEAELYRGSFYDDEVVDGYTDFVRDPADAPLRMPACVTGLSAAEAPVILDGQRYSEVTVTYTAPDDVIWHHAETWWRADTDPADSWHYADQSFGGTSIFTVNPGAGKQLHIRVVSVSRYGVKLDPRSADNPEVDLYITGTTDTGIPGAPQNLTVTGHSGDNGIPVGTYRVAFDSGANWQSVSVIEVECSPVIPFVTPTHHWEIQQDPGSPAVNGHFSLDLQESAGGLYFRVRAINSYGEGSWATTSATVSSYTDAGLPGGPSALSVAVNGYDITVRWQPPADNAAGIKEYNVRVGRCAYDGETIPTGVTATVDATQREATVRVTESGDYAIGVWAVNDHGAGPMTIFEEES